MPQPKDALSGKVVAGIFILLAILFSQLVLTADRTSITWDEDDHLYAGYMSWKHADFGLNPEHPPLVKLLAAIPILNLPLKVPELQKRNFKIEAFLGGRDFLFKNDANTVLLRARIAASLLTLLLALLVFLATREMFGTCAAFIALALLAFDPNLVAHGAVVTTDAALSCFMFGAIYAFYRYVKAPGPWRLAVVGIATGLCLASKHTGILLFPMLLVLAVKEAFWPGGEESGRASALHRVRQFAIALLVVCAISVTILWSFYGFRYAARAEGWQMNPPLNESLQALSRPRDIWLLSTAARFHLLPESYIYGLADVRFMADFYTSYLFDTIYPHGVWFYFPAAIAIKSTLTFLLLLVLAAWAVATRKLATWREILFLTIPSAIYLAVAMGSGMNIGVRHVLPIYMFMTVLVAGAARTAIAANRRWAYVVGALLIFQAVSSLRTYPAYIAYANELWGGPSQTYRLLSDSNADWGQQLKATKRYLDQRGIKDCWFIYFAAGVVDPGYYGIPCKPLPTVDTLWVNEPTDPPPAIDGPVLVSVGTLSGFEFGPPPLNPYEQFKHLRPTATIEHGIFVFEGHFEIPLAAAISHTQRASNLLADNRPEEAFPQAQQAVALAPDSVRANAIMGDVLTALHRKPEARPYYQKALEIARTVQPEFQLGWVTGLEQKLAGP